MANIIDKFLNTMKLNDDEFDDEYDDEYDSSFEDDYDDEPEEPVKVDNSARYAANRYDTGRTNRYAERQERESRPVEKDRTFRMRRSSDNVVPMSTAQLPGSSGMAVCMMKPTSFSEAMEVCDVLLGGRAALINLEGADVDAAQRIIDFVSGACYSIEGTIKMVSTYIFMASPSSIELSGDFGDRANISDGSSY